MNPDESAEIWKTVPGWQAYEASTLGRIRRNGNRSDGRRLRIRVLKYGTHGPYPIVVLHWGRVRRTASVHSVIAETFHGPCPSGMEVNHKDYVKTNNRPGNLEYVTKSEQHIHAHANPGRKPILGEDNPYSKLSAASVTEIRRRFADGDPALALSCEFGISKGYVYDIANRKTWRHVS